MSVFGNYAHYYDLLYRDKNYAKEADYVDKLIKNHDRKPEQSSSLAAGPVTTPYTWSRKVIFFMAWM